MCTIFFKTMFSWFLLAHFEILDYSFYLFWVYIFLVCSHCLLGYFKVHLNLLFWQSFHMEMEYFPFIFKWDGLSWALRRRFQKGMKLSKVALTASQFKGSLFYGYHKIVNIWPFLYNHFSVYQSKSCLKVFFL